MKSSPLAILFAGQTVRVTFLDDSTKTVHVRALPQVYLHQVIARAEHKDLLVELCTYTKLPDKKKTAPDVANSVRVPDGYEPVPAGWTENLSDGSLDELYEVAKRLNFQRAEVWARGQIAAKKMVAPLYELTIAQVMPLVEEALKPLLARVATLSTSTPSAPSSSAAPAKS